MQMASRDCATLQVDEAASFLYRLQRSSGAQMKRGILGRTAVLITLALTSACIGGTDEMPTTTQATSADKSCSSLVDARRTAARRIDDAETGRAGASATAGLFMVAAILGAGGPGASTLAGSASKQNQRALEDLRSSKMAIDREIDDRQCTLEAQYKAGALKAVGDVRYDGTYAGKGVTESWCASPTARLTIAGGRVSGSLKDGSFSYEVRGQAYEDGGLSLEFKRSNARSFTDDFEGRLDQGIASFVAAVDASRKGCTYRFALKRDAPG
jgi:hypothetical protein